VTERFDGDLPRLRHNRGLIAASVVPLLLSAVFALAGRMGHPEISFIAPMFAVGGLFCFIWLRTLKPWRRGELVHVGASREGLVLEGRTIPHRKLRSGFVLQDGQGRMLARIERRWRDPIDFVVAHHREGRDLLTALGFDALQTTATFRGAALPLARPFRFIFATIAALVAALMLSMAIHFNLLMLVFVLAVGVSVFPSYIDVGADGVLARWGLIRRFFPAREIVGTSLYVDAFGRSRIAGVKLHLRSGEEVKLPLGSSLWTEDKSAMLVERIRHVISATRTPGAVAEQAMLARGDASPKAWVERLRSLGAGANATLRVAPVRQDALWEMIDDHAADPETRAAAAVALAPSLDEGGRIRLAQTAQATAEPRLRVVLDAALADDEEALEDALAGVERGARRAR
jgi:hypothetical protein